MSTFRIKELEKNITDARTAYYNDKVTGVKPVSDKVYDAWIDELRILDPKNTAVTSVGAPVHVSAWKKAKHQIPMGSLDKVNTITEFEKWVTDHCPKGDLFVSEKLDGLSIELIYENGKLVQGITRGDGDIGEDITQNVVKMGGVPRAIKGSTFTGSFRGEIILTKTNHKKYFADKANPRNAASGTSKRLDSVGSEHLDILLYQVIGDTDFKTEEAQFNFLLAAGCKTPNFKVVPSQVTVHGVVKRAVDLIKAAWGDYQAGIRETLDYDIDGLVIRLNDMAAQLALGEKDMRPKGAIAWKFANEAMESTIIGIEWQVGNSGRLTPVATVNPVTLVGATVTRASLYNLAYIEELGLDIGAKVLVARANDVIPRIEELIKGTGKVHRPPTKCPQCQGDVDMIGENLTCLNSTACPAQVIGRIKNWVNELNILDLGETLIEKLVTAGLVVHVSDLYTLTKKDLASLDRMGDRSAEVVYDSLWSHSPITLDIFLGGLSIPMIGSSTIRLIMDAGYDTLEDIMDMTLDEMEAISGIGPGRAKSLYDYLVEYEDVIDALQTNGLNIKDRIIGTLSGKTFCFTGAMKNKRAFLEQKVADCGGAIKSSVGKGLGYLVIADVNSTSSKAQAARKFGTKLISEEDFIKMAK